VVDELHALECNGSVCADVMFCIPQSRTMRIAQPQQPLLLSSLSASRIIRSPRLQCLSAHQVSSRLRHYASNSRLRPIQRHAARVSESEGCLRADRPCKCFTSIRKLSTCLPGPSTRSPDTSKQDNQHPSRRSPPTVLSMMVSSTRQATITLTRSSVRQHTQANK
jgi:hypothetical protein